MRRSILILLLGLVSCESIFHEDENKYIILDRQNEKIDILNAAYGYLSDVFSENYFQLHCRSDDLNYYHEFRSENCTSPPIEIEYGAFANEIYRNLYESILNLNYLIRQLNEADDNYLLGEACFLRGYAYFKLARLFGKPPLIDDIDVDFLVEKPEFYEVYEFIERDLLLAIDLLPSSASEVRIPHESPHEGSAKALLAEVYLAMAGYPVNDISKYQEAVNLSGEVIQDAGKYHFALLEDYTALWHSDKRHVNETVFGLYFSDSIYREGNNIANAQVINSLLLEDYYLYKSRYLPELKFYENYPENYRKSQSFVRGRYEQVTYSTMDTVIYGLIYYLFDSQNDPCEFISSSGYRKNLDMRVSDDSHYNFGTELTLHLLRYAQTLLTYAEAKARVGELDNSAYEAVNRVRRRANKSDPSIPSSFDLTPGLSAEQFIDSVIQERAWELCMEPEGRWYDIIRLDWKDKLSEFRYSHDAPNSIPDKFLTPEWYFYKLPQHDVLMNPKLQEDGD